MSKKCCAGKDSARLNKVGGQAVLEGVMMKSGDDVALAVRKEDGTIEVKKSKHVSLRKKYKILNIPLVRRCVNMVETLIMSMGLRCKRQSARREA